MSATQAIWSGSQPTASSSWYEAAKFANWLTSGNALQGAYGFSDATTFTGVDRATALTTYGTIYVLPTEDEWYKAAYLKSDGSGYTTYATGDSVPVAGTDANYNGVSAPLGRRQRHRGKQRHLRHGRQRL